MEFDLDYGLESGELPSQIEADILKIMVTKDLILGSGVLGKGKTPLACWEH